MTRVTKKDSTFLASRRFTNEPGTLMASDLLKHIVILWLWWCHCFIVGGSGNCGSQRVFRNNNLMFGPLLLEKF